MCVCAHLRWLVTGVQVYLYSVGLRGDFQLCQNPHIVSELQRHVQKVLGGEGEQEGVTHPNTQMNTHNEHY